MTQLTIEDAIARGEDGMQACTDKAVDLGFSTDAARTFVLKWLAEYGDSWSEDITEAAHKTPVAALHAHDDRAWGSVFSSLARKHRIRCVKIGMRRKGNGTAGARKWALVQ